MFLFAVLLLILLFFTFLFFQFVTDYILLISFIKGCLLGTLYDKEIYEDENVAEHTIQISIFVICFTFIWETNLKN